MNIEDYYQLENSRLSFTRQQASDFAKKVAGDFNPIHDVDSKRFCVPGDLLFSIIIHHYGLREKMIFNFSGMVGDNKPLILPEGDGEHIALLDENDKKYLAIECSGEKTTNAKLIESLTTHYVEFSSQAFLHILVPLLSAQNLMVHPQRPLVIYESMSFELDRLDMDSIDLQLSRKELQVNGKRGDVTIEYDLTSEGERVGHGCKRMVASGLREFDEEQSNGLVNEYHRRKNAYQG
jgi:hypothetical protein